MNWPGGTCFAPETLEDDRGRRILWTWALETRPTGDTAWSGVMTLPRVLAPAPDHTLLIDPVEELKQLRTNPCDYGDFPLWNGQPFLIKDTRGDALEMEITIDPAQAQHCGVKVRCAPDGREETVIEYDPAAGCLRIDVVKSTLADDIRYGTYVMTFHVPGGENPPVTAQEAPFTLAPGELLHLRIFLDRSILEVFANRRQCLTQRIYPTLPDSQGIMLFAEGGDARVTAMRTWQMAPTNAW
jgi:sucrose-6-phosphate hydrolase SacC (GH32 family)